MFNYGSKARRNADKIESMASWLILGGFIPLSIALVVHHQHGYNYGSFFTLDRISYLWVIAMGTTSLLVTRASSPWRGIVILGAIGLVEAAALSMEFGSVIGIVWPLGVLFLILAQYRVDTKAAERKPA